MQTIGLRFNHRTITAGDNLTFTPGGSHVLSGHIEPAPGIADDYTVTLKKTFRLTASDPAGAVCCERTVTAAREGDGMAQPVPVRDWPVGDYRFTLHPEVEGRVWREGPAISYRRRERPRETISISPLAPWTLTRDPTREPCVITDCRRLLRRGDALYFNLAQGFDVAQWLREGLIDRLHLVPLEQQGGERCNSHDIRPYIVLARRYDVPVIGGLGATWMRGVQALPVALRRVLGLLEAGVNGIELYECEILARGSHHRWMVPLFGDAGRLREFWAESNVEGCYPVSDKTCIYGYDNVSRWDLADSQPDQHYVWDLYGDGPDCL